MPSSREIKLAINSKIGYNIIFVITFIALFILNNDRTGPNIIVLNGILSGFTILYLFLLYFKPKLAKYPSLNEIFLFSCLTISCILILFVRQYIVLHIIYLVTAFYVAYSSYSIPKSYCKNAINIGAISILIQFILFKSPDGRHVLSYIDPNYSGYCVFSLILFSWYNKNYKISLLLTLIGCLLLSRAFYIAIIVFFFFIKFKKISSIFSKIPYSIYIITAYAGLFILSVLFVAKYQGTDIVNQRGSKDVTEFVDQSNLDRFMANTIFVTQLIQYPDEYLTGKDLSDYTRNVFINSPHNSLGQLILNYGYMFAIFYILLFCYLIEYFRKNSINFFPAFCSLLIYTIFLGGGIFGIPVIWWSYIYKASFQNR